MALAEGFTRNLIYDERGRRLLIETKCDYCDWKLVENVGGIKEREIAHRLNCARKVVQFPGKYKH